MSLLCEYPLCLPPVLHSLGLPTCLLCESGQNAPRGKRIMTCQRYGAFKRHCSDVSQVGRRITWLTLMGEWLDVGSKNTPKGV